MTECFSADAAVMRAEALSCKPGILGSVAFSRSGDPAMGDFGDAKLLRKFGQVPEDLGALYVNGQRLSQAAGATPAAFLLRRSWDAAELESGS